MQNPKANNALYNAGHILMMLLWCEKVMIDLIIINKHYKETNYNLGLLNNLFDQHRPNYYKKYFSEIIEIFLKEFINNINEDVIKKLKEIGNLRNALGHCKPSLSNFNILITPEQEKLKKFLEKKYKEYNGNENYPSTYSIKIGDDEVYQYYFNEVNNFDGIFHEIARNFKINYNWIQ